MKLATKQEEHDILLQIGELIAELGADSYISAAFEGCIELAQQNIANDELCSMKQRWQAALIDCAEKAGEIEAAEKHNRQLMEKISILQRQLDREQEWKTFIDEAVVSDADYEELKKACEYAIMTDDAAKEYISELCGFEKSRIELCTSKPTYEINRHKTLRVSGAKERHPYYYASDWNYIRFACGGYTWELVNGELRNVS